MSDDKEIIGQRLPSSDGVAARTTSERITTSLTASLLVLELPAAMLSLAAMHESALIALVLIDRRQMRTVTVRPTEVRDWLWRALLVELYRDPFVSLRQLLRIADEPHIERTICDAIRCPVTGQPRVFSWNFRWHEHEIHRLYRMRCEFEKAAATIREGSQFSS